MEVNIATSCDAASAADVPPQSLRTSLKANHISTDKLSGDLEVLRLLTLSLPQSRPAVLHRLPEALQGKRRHSHPSNEDPKRPRTATTAMAAVTAVTAVTAVALSKG